MSAIANNACKSVFQNLLMQNIENDFIGTKNLEKICEIFNTCFSEIDKNSNDVTILVERKEYFFSNVYQAFLNNEIEDLISKRIQTTYEETIRHFTKSSYNNNFSNNNIEGVPSQHSFSSQNKKNHVMSAIKELIEGGLKDILGKGIDKIVDHLADNFNDLNNFNDSNNSNKPYKSSFKSNNNGKINNNGGVYADPNPNSLNKKKYLQQRVRFFNTGLFCNCLVEPFKKYAYKRIFHKICLDYENASSLSDFNQRLLKIKDSKNHYIPRKSIEAALLAYEQVNKYSNKECRDHKKFEHCLKNEFGSFANTNTYKQVFQAYTSSNSLVGFYKNLLKIQNHNGQKIHPKSITKALDAYEKSTYEFCLPSDLPKERDKIVKEYEVNKITAESNLTLPKDSSFYRERNRKCKVVSKQGTSFVNGARLSEEEQSRSAILVAGNAGVACGGVGNAIQAGKSVAYIQSETAYTKTQEESTLGLSNDLYGIYFALNPHYGLKDKTSLATKQGINYSSKGKKPNIYQQSWLLRNATFSENFNFINPLKYCGNVVVGFCANNGCRSFGHFGTMTRTIDGDAKLYQYYRETVKCVLRAVLDNIIKHNLDIAILARFGCGIYAQEHHTKINNDFMVILLEVLSEPYGNTGVPRELILEKVIDPAV